MTKKLPQKVHFSRFSSALFFNWQSISKNISNLKKLYITSLSRLINTPAAGRHMKMASNPINHYSHERRGVILFSSVWKMILKAFTYNSPCSNNCISADLNANWFETRISWNSVATLRAISTQGLAANQCRCLLHFWCKMTFVQFIYSDSICLHFQDNSKCRNLSIWLSCSVTQHFLPVNIWSLTFTRYYSWDISSDILIMWRFFLLFSWAFCCCYLLQSMKVH